MCCVEKILHSSSACGVQCRKQTSPDVIPLREEDAYPAMPEDGYGLGEPLSDACVATSARFRPHNSHGKIPQWSMDHMAHVMGNVLKHQPLFGRKIIGAKRSGKHEIEVWG